MSRENVELLQRAMEHFVRTGEPAWDVIHPEVEVYDHDILDAGDYRGHAGYVRWLQDWGAAWESFTAEPERYIDDGLTTRLDYFNNPEQALEAAGLRN